MEKQKYEMYKGTPYSIEEPKLDEELEELEKDLLAHDKGARLVRNHLFTGLDAAALVGGFIYFV